MAVSDILLRLRLRGQRATKAGLDSTTRSVVKLDAATAKLNLGLAVSRDRAIDGNKGLSELQKTLAGLPGGFSGLSGTLFALAPVLVATAGTATALVASLAPVAGVAAAAGDGLLAAGQGAGVFALATTGIGKALKAAGDPKAYAAALAELPPAAQDFAKSLVGMKPLLDDLRQTSAAGFFPGADKGLALAARNFGPVQQVIAATAHVLGDLAERAGMLVGSSAFGSDLERVGRSNAKVLDILGGAVLHLVSAFRYVAVESGPLTQWLAHVAAAWALNAAVAAKAGSENGKLAGFFDRTHAVLVRLGSILGHVTGGLFGIGKAGTDSGDSMWVSIDRVARRFDAWANSVNGQTAIRRFFADSKKLMAALIPAIGGVVSGFTLLSLRLLPLDEVLRLLGPHAAALTVAFVYGKIAITAITAAAKLWKITAAISAFVTGGWTTAFWELNAAIAANPIGAAIIAIAALSAGLYLAYQKSETFRGIVNAVWAALQDAFGWLKQNWPLVLAILTGPFGLATLAIVKNFDTIKGAGKSAINAIIGLFNAGFKLINDLTPGAIKVRGHTIIPGIPDIPMIPALAAGGTVARAGVALVGDKPAGRGGELVTLPTGATVHDTKSSAAMLAGGGMDLTALVAAIDRLARRPIHVEVDGKVVARVTAENWAFDAAFA
jgi:hypothetical protein